MKAVHEVVYRRALQNYNQKKYAQSLSLFQALWQRGVHNSVIAYFSALAAYRLKKINYAARCFQETIQLGENFYQVMYSRLFLTYFALNQGELNTAEAQLKVLQQMKFDSPYVFSFQGSLYALRGQSGPAQSAFKKALEKKPDSASFNNNLGYQYLANKKQLHRALPHLRKAFRKNPQNPHYLHSLGWLSFLSGNFSFSVKVLARSYALKRHRLTEKHLELAKRRLKQNS